MATILINEPWPFCWKQNVSSFCKKFQHICVSLDVNFNELLINEVVSFEQLGPDFFIHKQMVRQSRLRLKRWNGSLKKSTVMTGMIINRKIKEERNKSLRKNMSATGIEPMTFCLESGHAKFHYAAESVGFFISLAEHSSAGDR